MFYLENVVKSENMIIKTGEGAGDYVQVKLAMNPDEPVFTVIVDAPHFTADEFIFWQFYHDGYTMYFDIRNCISNAINESKDVEELIGILNEFFIDGFYDNMIDSSFECECECDCRFECDECACKNK